MALQHFYSRIPARASMFNKADGFDTFACSDGLSREFIERELPAVYDYKLSADETALIRRDALPPVYAQTLTKSGEFVQSAVGFISSDYTGERSSYLVHTLVFPEKEKCRLLNSLNSGVFNPGNFVTDMGGFDITSPDFKAVYDYPELSYVKAPAEKTDWLVQEYDANTLKRFIFAVINAVCGKGKTVYPVLSEKADKLSAKALRFMNSFMQILPYHLREAASFVTYTGDFSKFPSFKIKFMTDDAPAVPPAKGAAVNFKTRITTGVKDEDVAANVAVVEFLYGLLTNDEVRREFLIFTSDAIKSSPALAVPSLKTLSDLIFLFRCCSSMFDENKVLGSDDKVYEFICLYEKYRAAVSDENRIAGMRCLRRYPETHTAIPKNVFAKVGKIYPSESAGVKRVIMNVVLDMIHTDIMRDKLFVFIKNNYDAEDPEVKLTINNDLCRVFYGGFLQPQILAFFACNYPNEPMPTRDAVLDKILLAIRTKNIQPQILEFLRAYYNVFTKTQKKRIYAMIFEMLPEGDGLAGELINLTDSHISDESESFKLEFGDRLRSLVEAEQRKREHPLLKCIARTDGFCAGVIIRAVFTEWSGRKIFAEYAGNIAEADPEGRINAVVAVIKAVPYLPEDVMDKFVAALGEAFASNPDKGGLFRAIESENTLSARLNELGGDSAVAFAAKYADAVITPVICTQLADFFKIRKPDGVKIVTEYAERHPAIALNERFALFTDFVNLIDSMQCGDIAGAVTSCEKLPCGKNAGQNISAYFDLLVLRSGKLDGDGKEDMRALASAISGRLASGVYAFDTAYDKLKSEKTEKLSAGGKKPGDAQLFNIACDSLNSVFGIASSVYKASDSVAKESITGEESAVASVMKSFVGAGGTKAYKYLSSAILQIPGAEKQFYEALKKTAEMIQPPKKSLFSRLFGRK